jgi:hypothetical protein
MVKLPSRVAARRSASLPNQLIGFRFILQGVQGGLYGAVNVVAEFPSFVFGKSFQRHVTSIATVALLGYKTVQFTNLQIIFGCY